MPEDLSFSDLPQAQSLKTAEEVDREAQLPESELRQRQSKKWAESVNNDVSRSTAHRPPAPVPSALISSSKAAN